MIISYFYIANMKTVETFSRFLRILNDNTKYEVTIEIKLTRCIESEACSCESVAGI